MSITDSYYYFRHDIRVPKLDNKQFKKEFGNRFIALCKERGFSLKQKDLAARFGVSGPFISDVKGGKKIPSSATMRQWACILGVATEYLETGRGQKHVTMEGKPARVTVDITDLPPESQRVIQETVRAFENALDPNKPKAKPTK